MMPYIAALLLLVSLALLWFARQRQKATGLPAGRIIYADTRRWVPAEEPLYDRETGLTGRPDYLVEQGEQVIPVEVKSTQVSAAPYDTHIYQLAAYCWLVHSQYGARPDYGILHYPNRTFAIDYTPELEETLLNLLDEMRTRARSRELARSHDSPARCSGCGYRAICDQRLQ